MSARPITLETLLYINKMHKAYQNYLTVYAKYTILSHMMRKECLNLWISFGFLLTDGVILNFLSTERLSQ